jgi:hypothetical protein
MNGYLTTGEFQRWCEEDREFKREMRAGINSLTDRDARMGERIAIVETEVENVTKSARGTSLKWSTGLTTVITVLIQAALAAFGYPGAK